MSYGIKILNEYGEEVVDFNKVYYKKSTGNTQLLQNLDNQAIAVTPVVPVAKRARWAWVNSYGTSPDTIWSPKDMHCATPTFARDIIESPDYYYIGPQLNLLKDDIVFYDISTAPILGAFQASLKDFPATETPINNKGVAFVRPEGNVSLPYTVISLTPPTPTYTDTYGLQLRDTTNQITFDSRNPTFTIYDHFYVNKNIMDEILLRNATIDLRLRQSIPNFLVAPINFINFYTTQSGGSNNKILTVKISKVDNQTIRLSNSFNISGTPSPTSGTNRTYTQTGIILIGK